MNEAAFPEAAFTERVSAGGRVGLIVGLAPAVTVGQARWLREQLEERFPGVTVAVVDQCAALVSFTFDEAAAP